MHILPRLYGSTTVLDCQGSFDAGAGRVLHACVHTAISDGCEHLVFNLAEMNFSDSMTIGLMLLIHRDFETFRHKVSLLQPQRLTKNALESCNLQSIIRIYETEAEALAHSLVPA